jgi:hypothetical protein
MRAGEHLGDFPVIEFRRYAINDGERAHFADYFESYFPEAFQQLGAIAFGQFTERDPPSTFTWIRGFHSVDDRATVNRAFYSGPVWQEHKTKLNDRLSDHTNVLLLRPLRPARGIPVLPAVDPVDEPAGAQGVGIAQIFAVKADRMDAVLDQAETAFAGYRDAGAREVGVLVTLDVPNNFPSLPFRTDGPYLVWLGLVEDDARLQTRLDPLLERSSQSISNTGWLRGAPERVVLDPTRRSRLRWLPSGPP